jgi:hypothetical protein
VKVVAVMFDHRWAEVERVAQGPLDPPDGRLTGDQIRVLAASMIFDDR